MKHILKFNEMKGQKLDITDITTNRDDYSKRDNAPKKKDYSGALLQWRKVDNGEKYKGTDVDRLHYQFAWKQKQISGVDLTTGKKVVIYPDFNYGGNAMICNLKLFPVFEAKNNDKYPKYRVALRFESLDDDIMYDADEYFRTMDEVHNFMKDFMKDFKESFIKVYKSKPTNNMIFNATLPVAQKYFKNMDNYEEIK